MRSSSAASSSPSRRSACGRRSARSSRARYGTARSSRASRSGDHVLMKCVGVNGTLDPAAPRDPSGATAAPGADAGADVRAVPAVPAFPSRRRVTDARYGALSVTVAPAASLPTARTTGPSARGRASSSQRTAAWSSRSVARSSAIRTRPRTRPRRRSSRPTRRSCEALSIREPGAWLATIARNECRARLRGPPDRAAASFASRSSPAPSRPEDDARAASDGRAACGRRSQSLPEKQREAVVLRDLYGLRYGEICVALGVSRPRSRRCSSGRGGRCASGSGPSAVSRSRVPLAVREGLAQAVPWFAPGPGWPAALRSRRRRAAGKARERPVAAKLAVGAVAVGVDRLGLVALEAAEQPRAVQRPCRRSRGPRVGSRRGAAGTGHRRVHVRGARSPRVGSRECGRAPARRGDDAACRRGRADAPSPSDSHRPAARRRRGASAPRQRRRRPTGHPREPTSDAAIACRAGRRHAPRHVDGRRALRTSRSSTTEGVAAARADAGRRRRRALGPTRATERPPPRLQARPRRRQPSPLGRLRKRRLQLVRA